MDQETEQFKSPSESCELRQTQAMEQILREQMAEVETQPGAEADEASTDRRCEKRYMADFFGTLTRISDVRPDEPKKYKVTIQDISRFGMRLKVAADFISSRFVEINFTSPAGNKKRFFLEVVRLNKKSDVSGSWLELGCRCANNQEINRLTSGENRS